MSPIEHASPGFIIAPLWVAVRNIQTSFCRKLSAIFTPLSFFQGPLQKQRKLVLVASLHIRHFRHLHPSPLCFWQEHLQKHSHDKPELLETKAIEVQKGRTGSTFCCIVGPLPCRVWFQRQVSRRKNVIGLPSRAFILCIIFPAHSLKTSVSQTPQIEVNAQVHLMHRDRPIMNCSISALRVSSRPLLLQKFSFSVVSHSPETLGI